MSEKLAGTERIDPSWRGRILSPLPMTGVVASSIGALFAVARRHRDLGDFAAAEVAYRRVIACAPSHYAAYNDLGVLLGMQGKLKEALPFFREVVRLQPDQATAFRHLGRALQELGQLDEAVVAYREAVRLKPDCADCHLNLGIALRQDGCLDEAIGACREALRLQPDCLPALFNLGISMYRIDPARLDEAVAAYREVVRRKPDLPEFHNSLGVALKRQGHLDEAIAVYREALRLKPDYWMAYNNLGNALQDQGYLDQAFAAYQEAMRLEPDIAETYNNLGLVLKRQHRLDEALAAFKIAVGLKPAHAHAVAQVSYLARQLCQWDDVAECNAALRAAVAAPASFGVAVPPFVLLALDTTAAEQQRCARQWALEHLSPMAGTGTFSFIPDSAPRPRLRIAYLSGDFHTHATAYLTAGLFEEHDRQDLEIIAYSYGPSDGSPMRRRLEAGFDRFEDIHPLSPRAAAEKIHADGIDILVDLKGYTQDARSEILGYRPAPIQVQFLVYPGTLGSACVDYLIADPFVVPEAHFSYYDEQIVHLPDCYQPNDRLRAIGPTPTRAEAGLPAQGLVFCSFNQTYKITPTLFTLWMKLLHEVPGSVLWLLASNGWAVDNLRREAQARGIDGQRLVFAAVLPLDAHLGRLALADLLLDTLPCNSHTTASDALRAGVPVLTCPGQTFASRVAGSLLQTMGLPELIASDLAHYEQLALALAREPARLAALKAKVKAKRRTSALFDVQRFARHLEAAYRAMWARYQKGQAPAAIAVQPIATVPLT